MLEFWTMFFFCKFNYRASASIWR